jgi:hypothetical protein
MKIVLKTLRFLTSPKMKKQVTLLNGIMNNMLLQTNKAKIKD